MTQVRRRGAALEEALLDAAWEELLAAGYAGFTVEAVAERAKTSRAVIYRRWPQRWDLIAAAVTHHARLNPVTPPDTGTLRDDLVEYLAEASRKRAEFAVVFMLGLAELYDESGQSPADLRDQLMRGRSVASETIFDRAVARGEVDAVALTPRVRRLPFDLLRNELMMTLQPVPDDTIVSIVDEVVMPLVSRRP
jgi:AcrR family transcriptional regulator